MYILLYTEKLLPIIHMVSKYLRDIYRDFIKPDMQSAMTRKLYSALVYSEGKAELEIRLHLNNKMIWQLTFFKHVLCGNI